MNSSSLSSRSAFFSQGLKGLLAGDALAAVELSQTFLDLLIQAFPPLSIQDFALVEEA